MASRGIRAGVLGTALVVLLSGCLDGQGSSGQAERPATQDRSRGVVERDVEAPEVFRKSDRGLWDGRPSLGGVWVAHPDVRDPERVIIRNPDNGQEVVGALFRRERQNPGPAFQVSSDAASALGMLAGNPVGLQVTALRTEVSAPPEERAPAADEGPQVAEAADAPEGQAEVAEIETAAAEPQGERRRLWPFGRRDRAQDTSEEATADTAAGDIDIRPLEDDVAQAPAAQPSAAQATAAAAQPAPASSLGRSYIQLGIFSVEANADRALGMARNADMSGRIVAGESGGNRFWRVIVGPSATTAERDRTLSRVRDLGFADAYAVAR